MAEAEERSPMGEWLQFLFVLLLWAIWLLFSGAWALLRWADEFLRSRWPRRAFWAGLGALLLLVGAMQVGPLVYGRFALLDEARHQAKTSFGRESSEMLGALRLAAFEHGFKDVIHQEEAFSLESDSDTEGDPLCVINIQLDQKVNLFGCFPFVFHIRKKVASPITPVDFKKKRLEERIVVE